MMPVSNDGFDEHGAAKVEPYQVSRVAAVSAHLSIVLTSYEGGPGPSACMRWRIDGLEHVAHGGIDAGRVEDSSLRPIGKGADIDLVRGGEGRSQQCEQCGQRRQRHAAGEQQRAAPSYSEPVV